jgi:hypothetical protein
MADEVKPKPVENFITVTSGPQKGAGQPCAVCKALSFKLIAVGNPEFGDFAQVTADPDPVVLCWGCAKKALECVVGLLRCCVGDTVYVPMPAVVQSCGVTSGDGPPQLVRKLSNPPKLGPLSGKPEGE